VGRKLTLDLALTPDEPKAQQIVDHIEYMVAIGVYRPGDDLPSAYALADHLGISRNMVQLAYHTLEERGVTSAVRGGSTSIAEVADARARFARRLFSATISVLRNLANPLKRDEIRAAYEQEEARHFRSRRKPSEEDQDN
jgi:DNA-binding transcriptional regulator YhcF (GntR family)